MILPSPLSLSLFLFVCMCVWTSVWMSPKCHVHTLSIEGNCLQYCNLKHCIFNSEVNQEPDGDLTDYMIQPQEIRLWHTTLLPMPNFWEAL